MSIRRKGNRWEIRVRVGGGQRLERTLPPGASHADALAFQAALLARRVDAAVGRQPRRLIDEALDEWIATSASRLKSWDKSLKYKVSVVRDYTAGKYLDELPDVAQQLRRNGIKAGAKPATINRHLAILRRVGNLCERWGWTDKPLGRRVELMGGEAQRHVYLSPAQVRTIARAARAYHAQAPDAITLAALTGLRRGELLRLRPAHIVDGCIVLDGNTKSGKPRVVPLAPEALITARRCLPWAITEYELRRAFEAARTDAGLPQVRFHDLRHAFASWLVRDGVALPAVRDLLGHSSLAVTSRYSHLAPGQLKQAVSGLKVGR